MGIETIVCRGFGSFGSVNLVVTRGYTAGAAIVVDAKRIAAGGTWYGHGKVEDEWKRRKKKINDLEEAIKRASGEIPQDVPEAVVVKEAVKVIEKAAEVVSEPPPRIVAAPLPPEIDLAPLIAAAERVEAAIKDYKARKLAELRAAEEDEEDVLLLSLSL